MNVLKKLRIYLPALMVGLLAGGLSSVASAQETNETKTNNAIQAVFDALGFDPVAAVANFTGKIGGIYITLLFFGFALSTGWMVYRHYKRSGSKG